jgi:hypothetical protein
MNGWMSGWINEWMDEWVNEKMNEWMDEMNDLNTHPWVVTQEGFDDCLTCQGGGLCSSLYTLCRVSDNLLGGLCSSLSYPCKVDQQIYCC